MSIVYYTKEGKFEVEYYSEILWKNLHSINDEPALIYPSGEKFWFFDGKKHRLAGPARMQSHGYKEFWINGVKYNFKQWCKINPDKTLLALYLLRN